MENHPIIVLLEADTEPTFRLYQSTAFAIKQRPTYLVDLLQDDGLEDLLAHLETRSRRFNRLLLTLGTQTTNEDEYSHEITSLLHQVLRRIHDLLQPSDYLNFLYAALPLCEAKKDRWSIIHRLTASQDLERLLVTAEGHAVLAQWLLTMNEDGIDKDALEMSTQKLATLVEGCPDRHHLSDTLTRWHKIERLKEVLRKSAREMSCCTRQGNNKKSIIDEESILCLLDLGLVIPGSSRVCENHLDVLCGQETLSTIRKIIVSYPCNLCSKSLEGGLALPTVRDDLLEQPNDPETIDETAFFTGEDVGNWRIVLSSRAYRNLQLLEEDQKIMASLRSKFLKLAAGDFQSPLVPFKSEESRVPLRTTKWRSSMAFLWQVDVVDGPKQGMEQQVVKVWTVGTRNMVQSMIDEVKRYQKGLSAQHVARCIEEGPLSEGRRFPKVYDLSENAGTPRSTAALDVRIVNQEFIDSFNKSFTLTDDLLESIIRKDKTAEFPFNLSSDEVRIIEHVKTPTLILGRSGTGKTTCLVFKLVDKYLQSCKLAHQPPVRQVLLTRSETLAEKLRDYAGKVVSTLLKKTVVFKQLDNRSIFDLDHTDFPLVCTYEKFLGLIGAAIDTLDRHASCVSPNESSLKLVEFKAFRNRFWPHFPTHLTKGLSPHLVYSEILGVIKGSIHTCRHLEYLEGSDYKNLSTRIAPNVASREGRTRVYEIFTTYEKLKSKAGELDFIDWIIRILQSVRQSPNIRRLISSCIQEVYIDEVQDMRCIDIALLLTLVHDPRGLHFAGDTAQAISEDSVFRFQEVKALFYDRFAQQSALVGRRDIAQPQLFTLSRNYRSHQGILMVASSVMDLLWQTFPDTVDKLEPEVGSMIGPTPILFEDCNETVLRRPTDEASLAPEHELLFGAEQVIITRDESEKQELLHKVGQVALVLTILQAKGMEFDDVILYNFMSTTPDAPGWRNLQNSAVSSIARFDAQKHGALCSELKNLYVAITRARVRFLMIETCGNIAQPFIELINRNLALPAFTVTSPLCADFENKVKALQPRQSANPHRWLAYGESLMAQGSYADASLCFRNAEEPLKEKTANAHHLESQGEDLEAQKKVEDSRQKFEKAVKLFKDLNLVGNAARLLIRIGRSDDAAELWYGNGNFREAALLFDKSSNYQRAADSWHANGDHNRAALSLRNGSQYDKLVIYLLENKEFLSSADTARHQSAVKMLLKQGKIAGDSRATAIGLVGSPSDVEKFYEDYEMNDSLRVFYGQQGQPFKLFNLLLKLGLLEDTLDLAQKTPGLLNHDNVRSSIQKIEQICWVDRIVLDHSDTPVPTMAGPHAASWKSAYGIVRRWDHSMSQKRSWACRMVL